MILSWPPQLRASGIEFDLLGQSIAGPITLVDSHQVASIDGGHWVATLADMHVVGKAAMLAYRRLRAQMQGGAHSVYVPVCDGANAPWPGVERSAFAHWSDGATWSDGAEWSQSVIGVDVAAPAAARTTLLQVSYVNVGQVVGGERFSINGHLYEIARVLPDAPGSGVDALWQIVPPLRAAVGPSDHLEFDNPVCEMTLLSENQMNMMTFRNKTGSLQPTFFETFGT